jgi:hypothetical protein
LFKNQFDIIIIAKKEILEASWLKLQDEYYSALEAISQDNSSP